MPVIRKLIPLMLALAIPAQAVPRIWKNKDASRSFRGEFVSRSKDKVIITMLPSRRKVSVACEQLHKDDMQWLRENHPLESEKSSPIPASPDAIYDRICFGDSRKLVMKKLSESKLVDNSLPETFFDRTGLNGVFHTRKGKDFFGMPASIYYGWDDANNLKELSFHSDPHPRNKASEALTAKWKELIANLTNAYGKPSNEYPKLDVSNIADSKIIFTHAWKLKPQGSLLLGAGREDNNIVLIVRYTTRQY